MIFSLFFMCKLLRSVNEQPDCYCAPLHMQGSTSSRSFSSWLLYFVSKRLRWVSEVSVSCGGLIVWWIQGPVIGLQSVRFFYNSSEHCIGTIRNIFEDLKSMRSFKWNGSDSILIDYPIMTFNLTITKNQIHISKVVFNNSLRKRFLWLSNPVTYS